MKKEITPNRKTGRMIAKNLIILLTLIIVTCVGMWAWFSNNSSAMADGVDVTCKAPDTVEIAIVAHGDPAPAASAYNTTLHLNSENYEFLENLFMTEVTGDGTNANIIKPPLIQTDGEAHVDSSVSWGDNLTAAQNVDYLSFDLYFRSKSQQKISMGSSSTIYPNSPVLTWAAGTEGVTGYNPSSKGDFSRDCIVGAVRFAVVSAPNNGVQTRNLLWIPAPNILYNPNDTEGVVMRTGITEGDTYSHTYYTKDKEAITLTAGGNVIANNKKDYTIGSAAESIQILNLNTQSGDYYVNYVTCNMWIEGEDDEARLALVNGKFKVDLEFKIMD